MAKTALSIKRVSSTAKLPEYDGTVFTMFSDIGTNIGLAPGRMLVASTGVSINIPKGYVGIIALSPYLTGPVSDISVAEGLRFIAPGDESPVEVRLVNNSPIYTRVIRNFEPLCSVVIIPVKEYIFGEEEPTDESSKDKV